MAEADWTVLSDGLDAVILARGVTAGVTPPVSSITNNFVFGFNSLTVSEGAAGYFTNQAGFAPLDGGSVRGFLQRGVSAGATGFAPMLHIGLQGPSVNDLAYLLGLEDDDPHHIVLRKAAPGTGLPAAGPVLRSSDEAFNPGTWLHLRLDMIVNLNGDVRLQVFRSTEDLGDPPDWQAIPGMAEFVDDALGIQSGSPPLIAGRAGFAFWTSDITRRGFFDQIEVLRQP